VHPCQHIYTALAVNPRIYTALDNQSHSAPQFAGQSALTAATTSLNSVHQAWYKRQSPKPASVSDHLSDSVTTSASHHTWSRVTGLQNHQLCTVPGTAASALRWSCPMHRATGCLDSPVAMPHTLGNWCSCHMPPLQRPHSTTRRLPATRLHNQTANPAAALHDQAANPATSLGPGNCHMRPVNHAAAAPWPGS
jgi:hypothetical protein